MNDSDDNTMQGPTEAEIDALYQKELAKVQEWAQTWLTLGMLDSDIKTLIVRKIGTLNKQQVQILQMQRTLIPFGVTPDVFVEKRGAEMFCRLH